MRFSTICLTLIFLFGISQSSRSQNIDLSQKLDLNVDTTLEYVLDLLSDVYDVNFSYNPDKINLSKNVNIKEKKISLKKVLKYLNNELDIEWELIEKQIILHSKNIDSRSPALSSPSEKPKKHVIQGRIKDAESKETMIGATIFVKSLGVGAVTNEYGFFSLSLPEGKHELTISFIGYNELIEKIDLQKNTSLGWELNFNEALLSEVVITDQELSAYQLIDPLKTVRIKSVEVEKIPKYLGESEPIKALTSYPGIQSHGDGSVYFYVRGGQRDQNLILLDEAPIYVPSHLLGFFSSITTDAIKDIQVYKGDIPAEKGGAISSIIDIRTKNGNLNHFSANGSVSPFVTRLALEGPLKKEVASYYLSLRSSHVEWLLPKTQRDNATLGFRDIYAKLNWSPGETHRVYFTFYVGNDELSRLGTGLGNFGLNWSNSTATFRWNHIFSNRFFANYTIYGSQYNYNLITSREDNQFWNERITNSSIKADYSFFMNPTNTIRFGYQFKGHSFNPGNLNYVDSSSFIVPSVSKRVSGHRIAYYSHQTTLGDKWSLKFGLRFNSWVNRGPSTIVDFEPNGNAISVDTFSTAKVFHEYKNLEPRISLSRVIDSSSTMKLTYNHNVQYLQLLSNTPSPFTSLAVWLPSGPNIKPQLSHDFTFGYYKNFHGKWALTSELFYRKLLNQIDYVDHPNLLLNPNIEGEIRQGTGDAYGLETNLTKKFGKTTGRIGYSYSRSLMKIIGINNGNEYSSFQDRPHQISFLLDHKMKKRWSVSVAWTYLTGAAYTTPTGFYMFNNQQIPYYSEKNNDRLPNYHRMDLSSTWKLNKNSETKWRHDLTLTIFNLYGRQNPSFLNFNKVAVRDKFAIPQDLLGVGIRTPTQLAFLGFIPSFTYNFKFK